jgi:membrane associated rhomboid family serine protease
MIALSFTLYLFICREIKNHFMAQSSWFGSAVIPFRLIFLMWAAFFVELFLGIHLSWFGIIPRTGFGLIGIVTAPMLHGNLDHLLSNTIPLFFLGTVLFFFYDRIGTTVFFRAYIWTNVMVWLFGRRDSSHIGASGVVYGLAFFLIFFGIFRRDFTSMLISIVVIMLYGGVIYGVLPTDPRVSWESHFAGALVGIYTAIGFSSKKDVG